MRRLKHILALSLALLGPAGPAVSVRVAAPVVAVVSATVAVQPVQCFAPVLVQPYRFAAALVEPTTSGLVLSLTGDSLTAGAVTTWNDASGNGYNCTQGTSASRPTATTGPNGRRVVQFDGVDDYMNGASFAVGTSDFTVFVVGYPVAGSAAYSRIIAVCSNADERDYIDANGFLFAVDNTPLLRVYRNNANRASTAVSLSTWSVLNSDWSGSQNRVRINDGTAGTASDSGTLNANRYRLGASLDWVGGVGAYFNGSIGAIRVFNRKLTDSERAEWVTYFRAYYGI